MDVIVTIPHGFCPARRLRICDLRANDAASIIINQFRREFSRAAVDIEVRPFYASTARSDGDLNRPATRNSQWRRNIRRTILDALKRGRTVLLFDIHSFPNNTTSFTKPPQFFTPQVVMLRNPVGINGDELFRRVMTETGLRLVSLLEGAMINDIMVQSQIIGAQSMLWEFNEDSAALSNEQLQIVASVFSDYVLKKYVSLQF